MQSDKTVADQEPAKEEEAVSEPAAAESEKAASQEAAKTEETPAEEVSKDNQKPTEEEEEVDIDLNDPEVQKAAVKIQGGFRVRSWCDWLTTGKVGRGTGSTE